MPKLYIIAGPNGAGKTTFAKEFLPHYAKCENFVNADLIALGLAPFSPATANIKAGKLLLSEIDHFIKNKQDFAFESTLAGKTYISLIKRAKAKNYSITIFYLYIPNEKLAQERVKQRVKEGGHQVPTIDIKRRFKRSWQNYIDLYLPLAESWFLFDNSDLKPVEIAKCDNGNIKIIDNFLYQKLFGDADGK